MSLFVVSSPSPLPSLLSHEYAQTLEIQKQYIDQLEDEQAQLMRHQQGLTQQNEGLKKELKQCVATIRVLNEEVTKVVNETGNMQQLFKKNQEEKEKLQLKLENKEVEEGKIKFVNQLDRLAYLTSVMIALTVFAIFGALSSALLAGGALFLYYQWSKKNVQEELENNLRTYSKAHPHLSQKICLLNLYPSFPFYTQTN